MLGLEQLGKPLLRVHTKCRVEHQTGQLRQRLVLDGPLHQSSGTVSIDVPIALFVVGHVRVQQQEFIRLPHHRLSDEVVQVVANRPK